MKRSEAVMKMVQELELNSLKTRRDRISAMEHVMGVLEEIGMRPPLENGSADFWTEWEPEDV